MKQIENKTILNDTISFFESKLGPIATQTQLTQNILNKIQEGRRNIKPWQPNKMCQYPSGQRIDEFNMNEGLGAVSLQPIIDSLNSFKIAAKNEIKTKFQAMGPENAKDSKLAIGAVKLIKEVTEAAKCFTKTVTNVNNLISSYIQITNKMVSDVLNKISQLEGEIEELKQFFLVPDTKLLIIQFASETVLEVLQTRTDIFDILGAVVELQNALGEAEEASNTLLNSKKRIMKHLSINLTLLQNRINSLIYYMNLRKTLDYNKIVAGASYMKDDFLDDFDFVEVEESSFNWSLTNSGSLNDCNVFDTLTLIPRLNKMMKDYRANETNVLIIDSRNEEGYIVVPENGDGLISAGLDQRIGNDTGFVFELSINNGETIIRCDVRGQSNPDKNEVMNRNIGIYHNHGKESFDYNKLIYVSDNVYRVFLTDNGKIDEIEIGSNYYFNDPTTNTPWKFKWVHNTDSSLTKLFPILYKVIDKTKNSVDLKVLTNVDLKVTDFINDAIPSNYTFTFQNQSTLPGDVNGNMKIFIKNNIGQYLVMDQYSTQKFNANIPLTLDFANDIEAINWNVTQSQLSDQSLANYAMYIDFASVTLKKYNVSSLINKVPHAGEKIKCKNWSLIIYPVGSKPTDVNKITFSNEFPGQDIYLFFLKAKWGFIPNQS
jgi:hypothetical protein